MGEAVSLHTVTPGLKGVTVWSYGRVWLATAGVFTAALLTASCHVTTAADAAASSSTTASPTASASAATAGPVVALGDSCTAGALLPLNPLGGAAGCLRSTKAYPVLVAQALHAPLTNVAC